MHMGILVASIQDTEGLVAFHFGLRAVTPGRDVAFGDGPPSLSDRTGNSPYPAARMMARQFAACHGNLRRNVERG